MKQFLRILTLSMIAAFSQSALSVQPNENTTASKGKILVVYYSRTGENYGVGNIKEGNTAIVAKMIAQDTNAAIFEIKPMKPYPENYDACTQTAKREKEANARPAIQGGIDITPFDTIYIGYPVWWGVPPMPVFTFIDKHNWKGKTVIPFCTHEGSGLSGTSEIAAACKGAIMGKGLAIYGTTAQKDRAKTQALVKEWLTK